MVTKKEICTTKKKRRDMFTLDHIALQLTDTKKKRGGEKETNKRN